MSEMSSMCAGRSARSILAAVTATMLLAGAASSAVPMVSGKVKFEVEANNTFDSATWIMVETPDTHVTGKLEKTYVPDCEPDTYMLLFDKENGIVNRDDNSSPLGNGWASGIEEIDDSNGLIDNSDGTRSLRIGLTGRADGLDGVFNGLFQNDPHHQKGEFTLIVTWMDEDEMPCPSPMLLPDGKGEIANPQVYVDRFEIGAEAFYLNYVVPVDAVSASIAVDNTTGVLRTCRDVDYLRLDNLVPLCDYCFTQIGGIDCECRPTDTLVGWFDKLGHLIQLSYDWDNDTGYSELCFTADSHGVAILAVTGEGDEDFDGMHDGGPRDIIYCDEREWGHGVCGCWTFAIRTIAPHGEGSPMGPDDGLPSEAELLLMAMDRGDINQDGTTDTADLGILLGNFGWILTPASP